MAHHAQVLANLFLWENMHKPGQPVHFLFENVMPILSKPPAPALQLAPAADSAPPKPVSDGNYETVLPVVMELVADFLGFEVAYPACSPSPSHHSPRASSISSGMILVSSPYVG